MTNTKTKVRDKFWLFASRAHDDDVFLHGKGGRSIYWSRITPAEGAFMLGTPNMIMVGSDGIPVPFSSDAYGYMESFYRMDRVLWSVIGSGGFRIGNEEDFICELATKYPNVTGAYLDDIFGASDKTSEDYKNDLLAIREKLSKAPRPMELWATCYIDHVAKYSADMYDPIDVLAIWNMNSDAIPQMEENFAKYEAKLPNKRKVLGLYLYDYGKGIPVPVERMKLQCETGLKWLRDGRIEGMVFLTNCTMGMGFPCDYWLRTWIDQVGDEEL